MTYKNSRAGLNFGGGKCVVNAAQITRDLMLKIGEAIHHLGGSYIAEDVGTTADAMRIAAEKTSYIECSDDPSPWTALGVYAGMLAAMRHTVLTLQKAGVG
jgi:leucine dehydrogenase